MIFKNHYSPVFQLNNHAYKRQYYAAGADLQSAPLNMGFLIRLLKYKSLSLTSSWEYRIKYLRCNPILPILRKLPNHVLCVICVILNIKI